MVAIGKRGRANPAFGAIKGTLLAFAVVCIVTVIFLAAGAGIIAAVVFFVGKAFGVF